MTGDLYIKENCDATACNGLCAKFSSANFQISGNKATVIMQPQNAEQHAECGQAIGSCPQDAIAIEQPIEEQPQQPTEPVQE